jgi:hypothetical protein
VALPSEAHREQMRALWLSHLDSSVGLAIVPIWENERGTV